jgi:hypothetical protein
LHQSLQALPASLLSPALFDQQALQVEEPVELVSYLSFLPLPSLEQLREQRLILFGESMELKELLGEA